MICTASPSALSSAPSTLKPNCTELVYCASAPSVVVVRSTSPAASGSASAVWKRLPLETSPWSVASVASRPVAWVRSWSKIWMSAMREIMRRSA